MPVVITPGVALLWASCAASIAAVIYLTRRATAAERHYAKTTKTTKGHTS